MFVQLLRGRDGLPGRDGVPGLVGPPGEHGAQGKEGPAGPQSGGATYIRWGKSSCPSVQGTEMVYTGIAAATFYTQSGGGANYLCMPKVPEFNPNLTYRLTVDDYSQIHEWNINIHCKGFMITMFPVLSAMFPQGLQLYVSQPSTTAHPPGPENTMVTSCLRESGTSAPVLNVWMKTWRLYQGAMQPLMVDYSTMLRLTAMAFHVLHIIIIKNSTVLCVQNKQCDFCLETTKLNACISQFKIAFLLFYFYLYLLCNIYKLDQLKIWQNVGGGQKSMLIYKTSMDKKWKM